MTRLQRLRTSIALRLAGWRRRDGRWGKTVSECVLEPQELVVNAGRVNDRQWMGAAPGALQLLQIDGKRQRSNDWLLTFTIGETPTISADALAAMTDVELTAARLTPAVVYGETDFGALMGA